MKDDARVVTASIVDLTHDGEGVADIDGRRVFVADVAPGTAQGHWPEVNVLIPDGIVDHDGGVPDYNAVVTVLRDER